MCPDCEGSGFHRGLHLETEDDCPRCEGIGVLHGEEARLVKLARPLMARKRPAGMDPVLWANLRLGKGTEAEITEALSK